jgi:hypothetical protein
LTTAMLCLSMARVTTDLADRRRQIMRLDGDSA